MGSASTHNMSKAPTTLSGPVYVNIYYFAKKKIRGDLSWPKGNSVSTEIDLFLFQ